ncbi:DEAD/DEAH box helicase family protein [Spongorhabdus nitratireducens]
MKLVWIHGAPAAGKLTVATTLQKNHGFKLFHNHLAVDISLAIYDEFGEKDFYQFTNAIRFKVLKKANELGVEHLVMTYMTCAEEDNPQIQAYLEFFHRENIDVYPIHLKPSDEVLLERTTAAERINSHKISCPEQLGTLLASSKFKPIEHPRTLSIDNSELSPERVAAMILNHIGYSPT